jgi:hypothetical protein
MTPALPLTPEPIPGLDRWLRLALIIGIVFLLLSLIGAFFSPEEFFRSYLMSYLFWIGLTLGSMAVVMMQYLTGGAWGILVRRTLESASQTMPLLIVLFIPIIFGIPHLYGWDHADIVRNDEILRHRSGYMNAPMFLLRAAAYFVIWMLLIYFLNRWSTRQDREGGSEVKLARLSAPGLILYVFTVTFATVDWAASMEPHWKSTMWGFLFVAGQGIATIAFSIAVLAILSRRTSLAQTIKPSHFQDLGKLLLMFVMLWAYFSFSQLVIVWTGNLTDEIPWYLPRMATNWGWVGGALIVFQFIIPFLLLLSRPLKRNAMALCGVVALLIFMRFVDLLWVVMPSYYKSGFHISWLTFSLPLAMGGLWVAAFLWLLSRRPLLPPNAIGINKVVNYAAE